METCEHLRNKDKSSISHNIWKN